MIRRIGLVLGILVLAMLPQAARAAIVLGASVGEAGINIDETNFDETDFSWKAYGGFRFIKFFGLRAEYCDFGNPEGTATTPNGEVTGSVGATGWNFAAEGVLPLGKHFELFATAGYIFWDVKASVSDILGGGAGNGEDFDYGAGAAFVISDLIGIRAEWQRFDADSSKAVDFITAGVDFRF